MILEVSINRLKLTFTIYCANVKLLSTLTTEMKSYLYITLMCMDSSSFLPRRAPTTLWQRKLVHYVHQDLDQPPAHAELGLCAACQKAVQRVHRRQVRQGHLEQRRSRIPRIGRWRTAAVRPFTGCPAC